MITSIVKDRIKQTLESKESISEKLQYFRELSLLGLNNLSESEYSKLKVEFTKFFNLNINYYADTYPTKLYRIVNNKYLYGGHKVKLQKVSDLIGPPANKSKIGRCNLQGESVFYAALDVTTAIWESKPQVNDYITLSEWRIKPGEKLYMHSIFNPSSEIPNRECQNAYDVYPKLKEQMNTDWVDIYEEILKFYCEEFTKPVSENTNYLFSAILASLLLQRNQKNLNGDTIEAISYPSVKKELGLTNVAILNSLVFTKLELVKIEVMWVHEVNYNPTHKDSVEMLKVSPLILTITDFDFENDKIKYNSRDEIRMAMQLEKQNPRNFKTRI